MSRAEPWPFFMNCLERKYFIQDNVVSIQSQLILRKDIQFVSNYELVQNYDFEKYSKDFWKRIHEKNVWKLEVFCFSVSLSNKFFCKFSVVIESYQYFFEHKALCCDTALSEGEKRVLKCHFPTRRYRCRQKHSNHLYSSHKFSDLAA